MTALVQPLPRAWSASLVVTATAAALAAFWMPGHPAAALIPLALLTALALRERWVTPRASALVLLALVLAIDNPNELPAAGSWTSPLAPVGVFLFENLNKVTGVEALRFPMIDVLIAAAALHALLARPERTLRIRALHPLLFAALGALALSEILGLLDEGDFRNSLYQLQQLTSLPLLAMLFLTALDVRRDLPVLAVVVLGATALKLALGLYFYEAVCRPMNWRPPYTNTHSDSVLFVVAFALLAALAANRRTYGALALAAVALPATALAMYINNRRLAWVELASVAAVVYFAAPRSTVKTYASRALLLALPVLLLYAAVGWSHPSGIFRPVGMVRSVLVSEDDRSTATRDIENFNLIWTLRENPILGAGFGHEYREVVKADDISVLFAQYRYVPHNSVLGLWAFTGMIGFALVWMPILAASFLAVRAATRAPSSLDRTGALAALAALVAYTVQGYGDMGLQSWPATLLAALAVALSAQLAARSGAFPQDAPLIGFARRGP